MADVVTGKGANRTRGERILFAAWMVAEGVVAGTTPASVRLMVHAAGLAHRYEGVAGAWCVAAAWCLGAGVAAGVGGVAATHVVTVLVRSARAARTAGRGQGR